MGKVDRTAKGAFLDGSAALDQHRTMFFPQQPVHHRGGGRKPSRPATRSALAPLQQLRLPGLDQAAEPPAGFAAALFADVPDVRPSRCMVPACDGPHYGRGFCRRHWRQASEGKDPAASRTCAGCGTGMPLAARPDRLFCKFACKMRHYRTVEGGCYRPERALATRGACSLPECGNPLHANGLCLLHDNRRRRHDDPLHVSPPRGGRLCSIPNCGRPHLSGGYCPRHYVQRRTYGDPLRAAGITAEFQKLKSHPLSNRWRSMLMRCGNPNASNYHLYGAKGIRVCERWRENFWAFVVDVGPCPNIKWQVHRLDGDGHYEPGNVRWASSAANNRARRSSVLTMEKAAEIRRRRMAGETIAALVRSFGVTTGAVHSVLTGRTWNDGDAPDLRIRRRRPGSHRGTRGAAPGLCADPIYEICCGIKARCTNPRNASYPRYGGQGITLHQPWAQSMRAFLEGLKAEIGPRPTPTHSIDRIDNARGYEPGNLRWATYSEQARNRRSKPRG